MTEATAEKAVILVVDDSKVIRRAASKMLGAEYEVIEAADGSEGWDHISKNASISVVFTDMQMPNMNGLELLAKIRGSENDSIASLPVIMVTGVEDNEASKKLVFEQGATDFVSKPFESIDLISRAKSHAVLHRKVVELEKQSGHDKLTGLFNTTSFEEQGSKAFSFVHRHKVDMTVVLVEIESFQQVFLKHGKVVAQQVIVEVSKRLVESLRAEDVAARIGVARFAMLLSLTNMADTQMIVERIRATIDKLVFDIGKDKLRLSLAAGISAYDPGTHDSFKLLVSNAETALQSAMQSKTEKVASTAAPEKKAAAVAKMTEADIQEALKNILQGNFIQIPPAHLKLMVERLEPFMQYVADHTKDKRSA